MCVGLLVLYYSHSEAFKGPYTDLQESANYSNSIHHMHIATVLSSNHPARPLPALQVLNHPMHAEDVFHILNRKTFPKNEEANVDPNYIGQT